MPLVSFVLGLAPIVFGLGYPIRPWAFCIPPDYANLRTLVCWQGLMISGFLLDLPQFACILILYDNHYQKAHACGSTLDIALEISTFVLTLTLLLFCWPQAAPSIWPLVLSSWTTNPHTLRHKNCFETNCLF